MLKNCWECVMGTRTDNEVYSQVLNGHALTSAWPESQQNEIMFRLPRPLNVGDTIQINGELQQSPVKLILNLATGLNNPDKREVACQVEANFSNDTFCTRGYVKGEIDFEDSITMDVLGQFPDLKYEYIIKVRDRQNLDIYLFVAFVSTRVLTHRLEDITFLTLEGDVKRVEDLKFKFS